MAKTIIYTEEVAHDIVEKFEELLDKHNIYIPDEDRQLEDDPDNTAKIYGITYWDLLEDVENLIVELCGICNVKTKQSVWNGGQWFEKEV